MQAIPKDIQRVFLTTLNIKTVIAWSTLSTTTGQCAEYAFIIILRRYTNDTLLTCAIKSKQFRIFKLLFNNDEHYLNWYIDDAIEAQNLDFVRYVVEGSKSYLDLNKMLAYSMHADGLVEELRDQNSCDIANYINETYGISNGFLEMVTTETKYTPDNCHVITVLNAVFRGELDGINDT